jgi:hypothetical protein
VSLAFYFDDDSANSALLKALESSGIDAVSSDAMGMRGRSDEAHLAFATEIGRVLCTSNMGDFLRLHRQFIESGRAHSGIVLIPQQRYSVGELLRRFRRLDRELKSSLMQSHVEFLGRWAPEE